MLFTKQGSFDTRLTLLFRWKSLDEQTEADLGGVQKRPVGFAAVQQPTV